MEGGCGRGGTQVISSQKLASKVVRQTIQSIDNPTNKWVSYYRGSEYHCSAQDFMAGTNISASASKGYSQAYPKDKTVRYLVGFRVYDNAKNGQFSNSLTTNNPLVPEIDKIFNESILN